ncbi:long-chain-fatty-acid--CoA ligase [Lutimaribacter sp. EGI FJ00015]|uniref:Long-chain-fatty-acid--CoA ligase n=1 Tax=Lutimaribacter degradans TaxID=2945989 RepID=A0ACC5ZW04_9RHOB|nr:long-chain-fatty-acid--CoA ligase [Lutimaribacter sp. EGI FJ00013]MCM2562290.1 long-chain-fatty-acid--CoA ligase [Lutimaribacter sp. EGI FJ00013]MCO0613445.1 long-chain-fatty-acid--CoA ligase [Lutimaribacter sp. EGI FJ00015]MCO0636419.1 long-chain-fatty-acid--CoA ligase [Lutimaribacter sp. EGI FJ00014]
MSDFEAQRARNAATPTVTTMMEAPLRVTDILRRAEAIFADQRIVSRLAPGVFETMSFAEAGRAARCLASALTSLGVAPGARVATLMWNHGTHLVAYYGIPACGAVLHTLNPRLSPEELAYIIADAGDDVVIVDEDLLPLWREVEAHVSPRHVIVNGKSDGADDIAWADLLEQHEPVDWPQGPFDENTPVAICYTSGTTGRPKGVVYSHRSIILQAFGTIAPDSFNLSARSVTFTLTPMFHVNAWGVPFAALMAGSAVVLPGPRVSADEILDIISAERVSIAFGVPTIWTGVIEALESDKSWDLPENLMLMSGGAAPSPEMFRIFDRHGIYLQTGWGMTETSPIASQTWLLPAHDKMDEHARIKLRASNGLPLPFIDFRIADEDSQPLAWDGTSRGELQCRGPWVTQDYIGHPHPIPATTPDGWLKTGDVAVIRPDGYVQLVDRLKDLIKSGGEWISSVDMENVIAELANVAEAAVIAIPDDKWGERPMALVSPRAGATLTAEQVTLHLQARYPKWMVPDRVEVLDDLPKTGTGKLNKLLMRQTWGLAT